MPWLMPRQRRSSSKICPYRFVSIKDCFAVVFDFTSDFKAIPRNERSDSPSAARIPIAARPSGTNPNNPKTVCTVPLPNRITCIIPLWHRVVTTNYALFCLTKILFTAIIIIAQPQFGTQYICEEAMPALPKSPRRPAFPLPPISQKFSGNTNSVPRVNIGKSTPRFETGNNSGEIRNSGLFTMPFFFRIIKA